MGCKKLYRTKLMVSFAFFTSFTASAWQSSSKIGAVYGIDEIDALTAINKKARSIKWDEVLRNKTESWLENQQSPLPSADKDVVRFYKPTHTLSRRVTDAHGNVVYPEGFEFNPLNHMKLPYRIVAFSFNQIEWVKENTKKTDRLLLAEGDAIKARDVLERPVFLLDRLTRERLNVLKLPSVIVQKGNIFEISEVKLEVLK